MLSLRRLITFLSITTIGVARSVLAQPAADARVIWRQIEPGYEVGSYEITAESSVLKSRIVLARFDPAHYAFRAVFAPDVGVQQVDARSTAARVGAVAAINANYFDPNGNTLGLVISGGVQKHRIHGAGRALTGVFFQREDGTFEIVQRDRFPASASGIPLALQAGPRLIVSGKPVTVDALQGSSRRSGIALSKSNRIILFATLLRFPGATFGDVQKMLLAPELEVTEALNFDGGGSSQVFLSRGESDGADLFVSGGDLVPVILTVVKKP